MYNPKILDSGAVLLGYSFAKLLQSGCRKANRVGRI